MLERPGLQKAVAAARAGRFDVPLVYRVDRFTRRIRDLVLRYASEAAGHGATRSSRMCWSTGSTWAGSHSVTSSALTPTTRSSTRPRSRWPSEAAAMFAASPRYEREVIHAFNAHGFAAGKPSGAGVDRSGSAPPFVSPGHGRPTPFRSARAAAGYRRSS